MTGARRALGALVLIYAAVSATLAVGQIALTFGLTFPYPAAWPSALGYVTALAGILMFSMRFGLWRLGSKRRGAWLLLTALVCSLVNLGGTLLLVTLPEFPTGLAGPIGLAGFVSATALGVGLLLTGVSSREIAYLAILQSAVAGVRMLLTYRLVGGPIAVAGALGSLSWVLTLTFLVSLGVSLLRPVATVSADAEQALPARGGYADE